MINENRALSAWRARTKTTDLQQIFEKNHGQVATKIIYKLELQRYPTKPLNQG